MTPKGIEADMDFSSRRKRRSALKAMLARLSAIRDAEQNYLNNVPDNFQCSESFETGENAVGLLDEIIGLLAEVY